MEKTIANRLGLFIIFLFAIAPFWAYASTNYLGRGYGTYTCMLIYVAFAVMLFERFNLKIPTYLFPYALFVLYTIFSDKYFAHASIGFNYLISNVHLGGFFLLLIIANLKIPEKFYTYIKLINILVLFIAFVVILIQQFHDINFFIDLKAKRSLTRFEAVQQRLPSIYTWLGSMAAIGLAFFPILSIMLEEGFKNYKDKMVLFLYIIGAVVAFFNKSRFIMLNYLTLLILIPIYKGFNIGTFFKYFTLIIFASISLYMLSNAVGYDIDKVIDERILEKNEGGMIKGSAGSRLFAFEVFGKLFPKYAIFGKGKLHGFGEGGSQDYELLRTLQKRSSQIHVGYLSLFYYYGLIGGSFFVIFLFMFSKRLYHDAKKTGYWGPLLGWSMYLLTNWTGVSLDIFIMGLIIAFFFNQYYVQRAEQMELQEESAEV